MRTRQGKSHLRRKKPRKVRNDYAEMFVVDNAGLRRRVKRLAPYLRQKSK